MVPPLAGQVLRTLPEPPVDDDAAADAGSENHPEDHPVAPPSSVERLGEREAVRVVLEDERQIHPGLDVVVERPAVQAGGVGVPQGAVTP
jgi:hypothetical protein